VGGQVISPTAERNPGMTRPFRFGVVAPLRTDLPTWLARVRRIADSGYSTLLMPDFPLLQPAPGPTLATAAALTDLRVGTWVYASPLRPAWLTAWEAHSLSQLTDGRFELGIGTGRPGIDDELRDKGMPAAETRGRSAGLDPRRVPYNMGTRRHRPERRVCGGRRCVAVAPHEARGRCDWALAGLVCAVRCCDSRETGS